MGLSHAVVTCVARDDLADGGAGAIAATIRAIRERCPGTTVEVLISDLKGSADDLALIVAERPDVLNHNIETVARLQRAVRPQAGYARSLTVLARAASVGLTVKSGLMVGLGESDDERRHAGRPQGGGRVASSPSGSTCGPTTATFPWRVVARRRFRAPRGAGRSLGLAHVQASPLTRSSYHAREAAASVTSVAVGLSARASAP